MTRTATASERDESRETLADLFPPGATVYTILRHRSSSGMFRVIGTCSIRPDPSAHGGVAIRWPDWAISKLTGIALDRDREGLRLSGAGMDMGYHLVYSLSHSLYPDGFDCIGEDCPSNAHTNGSRDYTAHHADGGYALRHRWL